MEIKDPDIWKKKWFREMNPAEKCLFWYVLDNSSSIGVWHKDLELASFCIGESVGEEEFETFKQQFKIVEISENSIFIENYVPFQLKISGFGALSEQNNYHRSIVREIRKHPKLCHYVKDYFDSKFPGAGGVKPAKKDLPANSRPKQKISLEELKAEKISSFSDEIRKARANIPQMTKEMLQDFRDYWCESKKTGKLLRFEKEKTFDINRRLKKWLENSYKFNGQTAYQQKNQNAIESGIDLAKRVKDGNFE